MNALSDLRLRVPPSITLVLASVMSLSVCSASAAIMTLDQVRPGMRGYGKTVITGTTITRFDVRIIDIMQSDGATGDFLFIKVGGPEIEASGGISAGMSGSPLYVNDQLVGAVAFTTEYSDTLYGYATPIEYMLPLLDETTTGAAPHETLLAGLNRCHSPLMVSGLSARGFARMAARMSRYGLRAVQGGAPRTGEAPGTANTGPIEPGASIGIQLLRGAVNVTALGTMTYVQRDQFLGFGHSFIHHGPSDFPLVRTVVHQSVKSGQLPFRVGSPIGPIAGTVAQDRQNGVAGRLNCKPKLVRLSVKLSGENLATPRSLDCELVRDPSLTPELAGIAVMGILEAVVDRSGGGSASYQVRVEAGDGRSVTRKDIVSDAEDVAGQVGLEVQDILLALTANPIAPCEAASVEVALTCSPDIAQAEIVSLAVAPEVVRPGEEVEVSVAVKPFRKPEEMRRVRLRIPPETTSTALRVRVHGKTGSELLRYDAWETNPPAESLERLLESIAWDGRRCNLVCDLAVSPLERLFSAGLGKMLPLLEGPTSELRDLPERPPAPQDPAARQFLGLWTLVAREISETPYVITGERSAMLRVTPGSAAEGGGR